MNKGSIWRKWNFHVHTKGTNKNDQFTSTSMDDFFRVFYKKAFTNKISAIGITDYFSIDRYYDAIQYKEDIKTKLNSEGEKLFSDEEVKFIKNIFIFPNVELRMMPSTDKGGLINIHCLFNPDYVSELENDFFSSIENQAGIKMNRHGMIKYGRQLHPEVREEDALYRKGLEKFAIDLKDLNKLISSNKQFKDNTIIVVSNSSDGASAIGKHYKLFENESGSLAGVRESIYKISNAIFSANEKDVKYFLGKRLEEKEGYNEEMYKKEIQEVISQRGSLKPCIVGCDAHKEADLFTRFTWIKADLTFEGLRQICFEPELRVKIQDNKPDYKEERLLIEKVQFISPNNVFSTNPIFLNPNLNVIIGGKSSGKSIFLYSIAKTLSADEKILKHKDGSYRYELSKIEDRFNFEITTKGGHTQSYNRSDDENSILPEIKYIPQNYLVKLAEPDLNKKGEYLNDLVRDLITEDDESKEIYNEFLVKVKRNDILRNSRIDSYFELLKSIETLERELKTKSNKNVLQANIEANSSKVTELNKSTGLTQEQLSEYQILRNKIEINNIKLRKFKNDLSNIKSFNSDFVQTLRNLKLKKDSLLSNSIQTDEIKSFYQKAYENIDSLFNQSLEIDKTTQTKIKEGNIMTFESKSKVSDIYNTLKKEEESLSQQIRPYLRDEAVKKHIELINQSIKKDRRALVDIDELSEKIQRKKLSLETSKSDIFKIFRDNYNQYIQVINALRNRTIELEKDGLKIEGKVRFNFPKLRKRFIEISDSRTASYSSYSILHGNKKSTDEANLNSIIEELKRLFDNIINGEYVFLKYQQPATCIKLIMDDYFFNNWEIEYKNDILGEMSTGKASFVILMLMIGLSKSKAPILIDQPEDNLDNRSITTELVSYLRNKKIERQIIVVTHNPNVVVNADAENVIVANQKGQNDSYSNSPFKFDYINGAIENSFEKNSDEKDLLKSMGIRQHIADVVEGGKEAFIMRERKYRFD